MHFSIPTSENLTDSKDNTHTIYNLQINGVHHCSLRYSQLHNFNNQLKKEFNNSVLSSFPSKKLLSLSSSQIESRKVELEKYIQNISQIPEVASSDTFTQFFLNAQKESMQEEDEEADLEVHVPGKGSVVVSVRTTQQTRLVYQAVASKLQLTEACRGFFGLFLTHHKPNGHFSLIRRLQGFESPCLSLKYIRVPVGRVNVSLRKIYWDVEYDKELMQDRTSLNILVALAKSDLENGWVKSGKEEKEELKRLFKQGSKKEFMRMVWSLPYYGHIQSDQCFADFPALSTPVTVSMGGDEVRLLFQNKHSDLRLKVTRIRCWRITSIPKESRSGVVSALGGDVLELSMEYLVSKDSLRWISVCSNQAILMSMCLQSMVDELLMKKSGRRVGLNTHQSDSDTSACKFTFNRLNEMDFEEQKYFSENNAFDEIKDDDL